MGNVCYDVIFCLLVKIILLGAVTLTIVKVTALFTVLIRHIFQYFVCSIVAIWDTGVGESSKGSDAPFPVQES